MPDPLDQPLSTLIGHELEIATRCGCTRVVVFTPETLVGKFRHGVTLRIAQDKLICSKCGQRPTLLVSQSWATSGGRDRRSDPPALPEWVVGLLGR